MCVVYLGASAETRVRTTTSMGRRRAIGRALAILASSAEDLPQLTFSWCTEIKKRRVPCSSALAGLLIVTGRGTGTKRHILTHCFHHSKKRLCPCLLQFRDEVYNSISSFVHVSYSVYGFETGGYAGFRLLF